MQSPSWVSLLLPGPVLVLRFTFDHDLLRWMLIVCQVLSAFVPPVHYGTLWSLELPHLRRSLLRGHHAPQSRLLPGAFVHVLIADDLDTFQLNPLVPFQGAKWAGEASILDCSIDIEDFKQL